MHPFLIVGLVVILLGMALISWIRRAPPGNVQPVLNSILLVVGGAFLVFLAARTHWSVLGLAAIPILQRLAYALRSAKAAKGPTPGQMSEVETEYLRMSIDHDSGQMAGRVLKGEFAGMNVEDMDLEDLRRLHTACADDPQSVSVLEAFLDRTFDWRDDPQSRSASSAGGQMTREEALSILDLSDDATPDNIIEAHRRLMQRVHPDRGGSDYLAAQINRAKDVLLGP